jgi:hypothetical protein
MALFWRHFIWDFLIDIETLQNRLLKVCYVPATSACLPRVSFFFSFLFLLLWPLTVLTKQTRQAVCTIKQSIFVDVYGFSPVEQRTLKNVNNCLNTNIYSYLETSGFNFNKYQCRETAVLSCHRCLINTGVENMNNI